MAKKARLNLELDAETKERLDSLKEFTESSSLTDVIRRALKVYEMVMINQDKGGTCSLMLGDECREIIIL